MYSIFRDLAIIILSAKFFGLAARKCKAPQVVGEILAGLLIGPCLLNLVQINDTISVFAEIGVVLLMFSTGLGTNLKELMRAGPELELTGLLVVEIDAGQIGGQQVGRELHPFEVPAHRARKCTQEHCFAGAGLIFQQYMASAEEADQNFLGSILFAHNDAGTVGHNFFAVGGKSGSVHWCFLSQKQFF